MIRGQPWIPVNPSLHAGSFLICQMEKQYWNIGIKMCAITKVDVVRMLDNSVKLNLQDVMKRMLQVTHPVVVAKQRKLKCSICGQLGHTA